MKKVVKKLLITGSGGYLGSKFVEMIPRNKYDIITLNKSGGGDICADICDDNLEDKLPDKVDIIIHIAGLIEAENPKDFFKVNARGTYNLVNYAKKCGARKFIYVSSMAVTNEILSEYGLSKLKAEDYIKISGLDYLIFRPSMIFSSNSPSIKALTSRITMLPFFTLIVGGGKNYVAPIHVNDVAEILLRSIEDEDVNKTYNLGGEKISLDEFFKTTLKKCGERRLIIHLPLIPVILSLKFLAFFAPQLKGYASLFKSMTKNTKVEDLPEYYKMRFKRY